MNVDVLFYLLRRDKSARNKNSDGDALFAMQIKWLTKFYYVGELKLSEVRLLIGSGAEYTALLELASGKQDADDFPAAVEKAIPLNDFIAFAKKFEKSQAYAFFANL